MPPGPSAPPATMRALRLNGFGPPDVLRVAQVPTPQPGPGEVLVRVAYCGICRHDVLSRQGAFPNVVPPVTPGHQVSGHVVLLGEGCSPSWVGRAVTTMLTVGCGQCPSCGEGNPARCHAGRAAFLGDDRDGGCADYLVVPEVALVPLPDGMGLVEAAVVNCTLGTAYHAAVTRGAFEAGETVLVTGASGGVGLHAVRLLAHLGVRCLAVTTRPEKAAALEAAGADAVVVAPDLRFASLSRSLNDGRKVDAVLDIVGATTLAESIRAVRDGGRVVVLGNVDGGKATISPALFILREISVVGTGSATKAELTEVLRLVASGALDVAVDRVFPLEEAARVHTLIEEGGLDGRGVLELAGERS